MDDSTFAKLGFDPIRIHAHFYGQPAPGRIARFSPAGAPVEVKDQTPAPLPEQTEPSTGTEDAPEVERVSENPPRDGEVAAAPAADGGGSDPGAAPAPRPLHHSASPMGAPARPAPADDLPPTGHSSCLRPPPRAGEDHEDLTHDEPNPSADMQDWLVHNWEAIKALEAAGQLPELTPPKSEAEPAEAAAEPAPEEPTERSRPHVARGDRWTKWKMAEFLRHLAATHSVTAAARAVGMHRRSAYKLRSRLKGQPFDIAWEAAFRHGYDDLAHAALELALEGEEVPHYHQGEIKGTHRKRHPQLMVQLLKMRNRVGTPMLGRYGAAAEYWSENWEQLVHRVETGSVSWDDEHKALSDEERSRLDLPDEKKKVDQIIERNSPDEPRRRFGK